MPDTILILEDEPFIAINIDIDIESALHEAGPADIVTLTSCADALLWLAEHTPITAVIAVCPMASALWWRGIS